jgi:hypothetical protein
MATLTKRQATASFIVSEASGYRSRDDVTVTVPANTTYSAGTLLGKITASGKFVRHAAGAGDGSENEAGVLFETIVNATGSGVDSTAVNFARDAEVNGHELTYEDGADSAQIIASDLALKALGIIVRR